MSRLLPADHAGAVPSRARTPIVKRRPARCFIVCSSLGFNPLSLRERGGGEGTSTPTSLPHPNPLPEGEGIKNHIDITVLSATDREMVRRDRNRTWRRASPATGVAAAGAIASAAV